MGVILIDEEVLREKTGLSTGSKKTAVLKPFGLRIPLMFKIIEGPKELLFIRSLLISTDIY